MDKNCGVEERVEWRKVGAAMAVVAVVMVAWLFLLGRVWWCELGDGAIYVNEAWNSNHTSQHFFDPYSFTHVLHGVLFFWVTGMWTGLAMPWRLAAATVAEAGWEVLENTNYIIDRYRENTASLDYFGDSIANSIGDLGACVLGFGIAVKFGMWRSLAFFAAMELLLLLWIRDSLLLNVVMLVYPLDAIRAWQGA